MSDHAVTKILVETARELFTAPEKKQFKKLGDELREAYAAIGQHDAGRLTRNLAGAQEGNDAEGRPITDAGERVANLHACQKAILEGPLFLGQARNVEARVFSEAKQPSYRLLQAAAARAEKMIHEIPPLPLPPAFEAWQLSADLEGIFRQMAQSSFEALNWEILPRHWSMNPREAAWNWLSRAGLTEGEK